MGTTVATLHVFGVNEGTLSQYLKKDEVVRAVNLPWLSVFSAIDRECEDPSLLYKRARELTKALDSAWALTFFYFDDDVFECRLFRSGKCVITCQSDRSWAKFGKQLDLMFGDDRAAKALRYFTRCLSLEEKVRMNF